MSKKPPDGKGDEDQWPLAPDVEQPPPGRYVVAYRRARIVDRFGDRWTIELHFSIVEPSAWLNFEIILYCSTPKDALLGKRSKYYELWTLANGAPPKRRDRMTPSVFDGWWHAKIVHTCRRMEKKGMKNGIRELKPTETATAVIETLVERAVGGLQKGTQK